MRIRPLSFSVLLFGACCSNASAGLIATSDEIAVSSYTTGTQARPAITATADGGFFVVWQDQRPQVDGVHVLGQRFDSSGGAVGTQVQVDAGTTVIDEAPAVVAINDGFVVAWRRGAAGTDRARIVARTLDAAAAPVGSEFQVNTARTLDGDYLLGSPVLAAAKDGGFIVAWSSGMQTSNTTDEDVYTRRFTSQPSPAGDDVLISFPPEPDYHRTEYRPDIRVRDDGSFVIVWTDAAFDPASFRGMVRMRVLDASGIPVAPQHDVTYSGGQTGARVTGAGTLQSLACFFTPEDSGRWDLRAREHDENAQGLTEEMLLTTSVERELGESADVRDLAATTLGADRMVAVWTDASGSDTQGAAIVARVFDTAGYSISGEQVVNVTTAGDQFDPEVASIGNNRAAVVWNSSTESDLGDVFVRTFDLKTPACGDGDENGATTAADALVALQAAVGARDCPPCACDPNASGRQTAADALLLLRASVGQSVTLSCPACPAGPAIRFDLKSQSTCAGAHVEIPTAALPADPAFLSCTLDPQVTARAKDVGCDVSLDETESGLALDTRNCVLSNERLFSCFALGSTGSGMTEAARAGCGCACEETCFVPQLCTTIGDSESCSAGGTPIPPPAPAAGLSQSSRLDTPKTQSADAPANVTVQDAPAISTTTSSTSCGTCCGPFDDTGTIELASDVELTELLVKFDGDVQEDCSWCDPHGGVVSLSSSPGFCLATFQDVIRGPLTTSCQGYGVFSGQPVVLRALGRNFEPLASAPVVNFSRK